MSENMIPGAYDQLITEEISSRLKGLPAERVLREVLEEDDAPQVLARHLQFLIRRALLTVSKDPDSVARIRMSNQIVRAIAALSNGAVSEDDLVSEEGEPVLWAIERPIQEESGFQTPSVRLSESALLVNGRNQPSIGHELNKELTSAENVDLLCSFVMNTGLNVLEKNLASVISRGGKIRVLTTTYMGATQKKALDRLVKLGAEVRISFDGTTTRLHAKSWLLHRSTGATTAYVGSSNLSKAALTDGIEWNVRVSAREQPHIIETIDATFENYWNDTEFETYVPERDGERLIAALQQAGKPSSDAVSLQFANIEVLPRPYQQEVLDQLESEREIHGHWENLVVMATGTGKTIVAGLDFRRLVESGHVKTLLFVAHREQILSQSLVTFRTIMRNGSFGELLVDGNRPTDWSHVFGSVQSINNLDFMKFGPDAFDMIIVDEFHHAAAKTYETLLAHFKPKVLLGLTATPERSDGQSILHWFANGVSAELRLWEAIDRQILSPFQYFGLNDNVDLESAGVTWRRGFGYDAKELSNVYTGNDARVALILEQMDHYVDDISSMKAIGFCVSIEHAEFMARKFNLVGIPSSAVTSNVSSAERKETLGNFRNGSLKTIFAVDIFNEGVDIPDVNTLLMLRPTESATVFIQQLGRGLRKAPNKNCLTVLDFVGNQNKNFRFDLKYGRLLGLGRRKLADAVENGFPYLPSGCHFELDRVSREQVLENLKTFLRFNKGYFINDIKSMGKISLGEYVEKSQIDIADLYRNGRSFTLLKRSVFEPDHPILPIDVLISRALGRVLHIDDENRIAAYSELIEGKDVSPDDPYAMMLAYLLFNSEVSSETVKLKFQEARQSEVFREVQEVLKILDQRRARVTAGNGLPSIPLQVHATYTRAEVLAGFGIEVKGWELEGVVHVKEKMADIAFVTLNKSAIHFSPTTMYADTAISSHIFQWESQSKTSESSPTGQRYITHKGNSTFHLFVRDFNRDPENQQLTMPFLYLGTATYMEHTGSKPMRIRWYLDHEIPADILAKSKVIAS
jgi:superfamily II DNA or RNA helicase/HKD family nuclease